MTALRPTLDDKAKPDPSQQPDQGSRRPRLAPTVIGLGLVSLFTDLSSETIFPLLPAYLALLGASAVFVGAVEGSAELISNLLKYASGIYADRRTRKKPLVLWGYGLSTLARPLMAFTLAPWHVLVVRSLDRIGKGVRTSPRDALIAAAAPGKIRARAYGFHRAMDHAGAALGTLLSAGLLFWLRELQGMSTLSAMRWIFALALMPGLLAMAALILTPESTEHPSHSSSVDSHCEVSKLRMPPELVALVLFACSNATDAFLIVKAISLGASPELAPLLWLELHVIKALLGAPAGRLADRFGKRLSLIVGWVVYATTWGSIGFVGTVALLFVATAAYATSHGLVEGAEKALVAELAPHSGRGRAFGRYHLAVGLSGLVASLAFGAAWDRWGDRRAFIGSAILALVAAAWLAWLSMGRRNMIGVVPAAGNRDA